MNNEIILNKKEENMIRSGDQLHCIGVFRACVGRLN